MSGVARSEGNTPMQHGPQPKGYKAQSSEKAYEYAKNLSKFLSKDSSTPWDIYRLLDTIEDGDAERIQQATQTPGWLTQRCAGGETPLILAVHTLQIKALSYLISVSNRDQLNLRDHQDRTALDIAKAYQFLTDDINISTPLSERFLSNQRCISLLVNAHAKVAKDESKDGDINVSFSTLCDLVNNDAEFIKALDIAAQQPGFNINERDENGMTLLHHAARAGKLKPILAINLKKGVRVNIFDNRGNTPLDYLKDVALAKHFHGRRGRYSHERDDIVKMAVDSFHEHSQEKVHFSREVTHFLQKEFNWCWSFEKIEIYLRSKGWFNDAIDLVEVPEPTMEISQIKQAIDAFHTQSKEKVHFRREVALYLQKEHHIQWSHEEIEIYLRSKGWFNDEIDLVEDYDPLAKKPDDAKKA